MLTVLGEAERFGAVFLNGAEVVELISTTAARARASSAPTPRAASASRSRAANVVNATGVWADRIRPEEILAEEEVPRIAPSRGTHVTVPLEKLPLTEAACIVPAGEERTIFALPWYGRALIGTTDRDYDGDIAHVQPSGDDIEYLLEAVNSFFGLELGAGRPHRRLRGRAAADLDRRSAQVGGHLAQGGAVRDVLGAADDHRRQADHLAADGEAGRRPDGRARGPRGALPHRRDPAGHAGAARRPGAARGPVGGDLPDGSRELLAFRYGHAARNVLKLAGERPELAGPIVPGQPDLLAEAVIAARLEQARSVADVLLRRTRLGLLAAPQLRDAESVRPVAEAIGGELGWSADARPSRGRGRGSPSRKARVSIRRTAVSSSAA